jgi:hypothetical protein
MAAQKMAGDFFNAFGAKLYEMYGAINAAPPPPPRPVVLVARLVAWIKRLFGPT